MRYFTTAIIIVALFVIGFTANPALANCHAKIDSARAQLASVSDDNANREEIENLINKAEKFQDDKKRKKKCGKILKKATNMMGKAKKGGGGKCAPLIQKVEDNLHLWETRKTKHLGFVDSLYKAKALNEEGKGRKCSKLMKKTIKKMDL